MRHEVSSSFFLPVYLLKCYQEASAAIFHPLAPAASADLSEDDLKVLNKWVNPTYLTSSSWSQIKSKFTSDDGSILLYDFLKPEAISTIVTGSQSKDKADSVGRVAVLTTKQVVMMGGSL